MGLGWPWHARSRAEGIGLPSGVSVFCCPNSGPHLALVSEKHMSRLPELTRVLAGWSMEEKGLLHQAPQAVSEGVRGTRADENRDTEAPWGQQRGLE